MYKRQGIGKGVEIQVDDIVQGADSRCHHIGQISVIFHRNISQGKTRQIADHKIPGTCGIHHHGIPVFRTDFRTDRFNGRHILGDFRTQVGTVDDSSVSVGIGPVDRISVEGKGRSGFHCGFEDQPHNFLQGDRPFGNPGVAKTFQITLFPLDVYKRQAMIS